MGLRRERHCDVDMGISKYLLTCGSLEVKVNFLQIRTALVHLKSLRLMN